MPYVRSVIKYASGKLFSSHSSPKYGIDINVGDTRGVSGIFRVLRTIPPMLDVARDMDRLCPNATMLNYTNPMAMLCAALQRQTFIPVTGLCHSVQGTAMMLAEWIGARASAGRIAPKGFPRTGKFG